MKNYVLAEFGILACLTAALLGMRLGGLAMVLPLVVSAWMTLQLISSVAFCNAINKGTIVVRQSPRGSKETYAVAPGARPSWLVMRHVWAYGLIREPG